MVFSHDPYRMTWKLRVISCIQRFRNSPELSTEFEDTCLPTLTNWVHEARIHSTWQVVCFGAGLIAAGGSRPFLFTKDASKQSTSFLLVVDVLRHEALDSLVIVSILAQVTCEQQAEVMSYQFLIALGDTSPFGPVLVWIIVGSPTQKADGFLQVKFDAIGILGHCVLKRMTTRIERLEGNVTIVALRLYRCRSDQIAVRSQVLF